jgi:hydroxyethylthiazole kinase-like sugar kinase family protein
MEANDTNKEIAEQLRFIAEEGPLIHCLSWSVIQTVCRDAAAALSNGPSREEVIEQCAEAVNLVRFNEAALHRKALTKAIEAIRALASTTATDEMAKVAGDPKDWSRNNQKWKDGGL